MEQKQTSYAFLMEMVWVSAFFLVCVTIFVMVFAKAERLSRQAEILNQAVVAASNTLEESFCETEPSKLQDLCRLYSTDTFVIQLESATDDGLCTITVKAIDSDSQEILYSLTGAKAIPEGDIS